MATQLQLRKGTKAQNDAFVGAEGEVTYDTQTQGLRIHDGTTQGGHMIDTVVAWQVPTAENNYTWYRKYASGWVEQGGYIDSNTTTVTLLVPMKDSNYTLVGISNSDQNRVLNLRNKTTSSFVSADWNSGGASGFSWQVSGMAAEQNT